MRKQIVEHGSLSIRLLVALIKGYAMASGITQTSPYKVTQEEDGFDYLDVLKLLIWSVLLLMFATMKFYQSQPVKQNDDALIIHN